MEKILCPTIHVHRQHDCSYVDVGTVCYTVSRSMFVYTYYLRASLDNVCSLDEFLPSLSGMGIGCVRARVFPCEPIFRKPAGEVYLCSNWSDVYLILRLAPI